MQIDFEQPAVARSCDNVAVNSGDDRDCKRVNEGANMRIPCVIPPPLETAHMTCSAASSRNATLIRMTAWQEAWNPCFHTEQHSVGGDIACLI